MPKPSAALHRPLLALALALALPVSGNAAPSRREVARAKSAHTLGMRALDEGRLEVAERFFRQATELLPDAPGSFRGLGLALAGRGDCEGAIVELERYVDKLAAVRGAPKPRPAAVRMLDKCKRTRRSMGDRSGGSLVVTTAPRGAHVEIDGKRVGVGPLTLLQMAPGSHGVRATLQGHTPVERQVEVRAGERAKVGVTLARTARLDVITRPPGATLELDGNAAGETPLSLPGLSAGVHQASLRRPGTERAWVSSLALPAGEATTLSVPLADGGGLLTVRSEPPGALVTLDDQPVGHTPLGPNVIADGTHWVRVAREGFALEQHKVDVSAAAPAEIDVTLKPVRLDLRIRGLVPDAQVYVDGELQDATGGWLRGLTPGGHDVAAWREGYRVWTDRVVLSPEEPAAIDAQLQVHGAEGGGTGPPTWWIVTSSTVGVAALAGAGVLAQRASEDGGTTGWVAAGGLGALGVLATAVAIGAVMDALDSPDPEPPDHDLELPGSGAP